MRLRHGHAPLRKLRRERYFVSQSSTPDTEPLSMMLAFDVRPTNESIRKGLKQHPIRGSHNDCQRCKVSKCLLADIARRTTSFKGMSAFSLWVNSRRGLLLAMAKKRAAVR